MLETTDTTKIPEDYVRIVTTRTWPGGWERSRDEKEALRRLRGDWRQQVQDYGYNVYAVHPDTYLDGLANFNFPIGAQPIKVKEVKGRKSKK